MREREREREREKRKKRESERERNKLFGEEKRRGAYCMPRCSFSGTFRA